MEVRSSASCKNEEISILLKKPADRTYTMLLLGSMGEMKMSRQIFATRKGTWRTNPRRDPVEHSDL